MSYSLPRAPAAMPHDEICRLCRAAVAGDVSARNQLIEANMGLVHKLAHKVWSRNTALEYDDLVQSGVIGDTYHSGLLRAIELFDPDQGCRFSTYAVPWIRAGIINHLEQISAVPRAIKRKAPTVRRAIEATGGESTNIDAIVQHIREQGYGWSRELIVEVVHYAFPFQVPIDELIETPDDTTEDSMIESLDTDEQTLELLRHMHARLTDFEIKIIKWHYGIGCREASQAEIGRRLNKSRERVRQILSDSLAKLRRAMPHGLPK